jgi:hypothetical protein
MQEMSADAATRGHTFVNRDTSFIVGLRSLGHMLVQPLAARRLGGWDIAGYKQNQEYGLDA